jgi:anti-sigma B factor antagonist
MKIVKKDMKSVYCISIIGDMEAYDAEQLETEAMNIIKKGRRKIAIDLQKLDYICSSGLRALLNLRSELQKEDGRLILAGLKDKVLEVFKISKLLAIFEVVETAEDIGKIQ